MGILNVTPDSFSDGGRYATSGCRARARRAHGGRGCGDSRRRRGIDPARRHRRSTKHWRSSVWSRSSSASRATLDVAISVDTSKPAVMAAATAAGACIVNDVYALRAPGAREWAAGAGVGVCLMHMQGEPRTMQHDPAYQDVVAEVCEFLARRSARPASAAGIAHEPSCSIRDSGFGKGLEHNLACSGRSPQIAALGSPLLVGVSRKSFIGRILGRPTAERMAGRPRSGGAGREHGSADHPQPRRRVPRGMRYAWWTPSCRAARADRERQRDNSLFRHRWRAWTGGPGAHDRGFCAAACECGGARAGAGTAGACSSARTRACPGYLFESALEAGFVAAGVDVMLIGPLPTPGHRLHDPAAGMQLRRGHQRIAQSLRGQRHQVLRCARAASCPMRSRARSRRSIDEPVVTQESQHLGAGDAHRSQPHPVPGILRLDHSRRA